MKMKGRNAFDQILLQRKNGQVTEWTILKPSTSSFAFQRSNVKYQVNRTIGFCHQCFGIGQDFHKIIPPPLSKNRNNFLAHLRSDHAERRPIKCDFCSKVFPSQEKLEQHYCFHFRDLTHPVNYQMKLLDSPVGETLLDMSPLQIYRICFHEKWALPSKWPPVFIPPGLNKWKYNDFSNQDGHDFIYDILYEMWDLPTREYSLVLDKNIHIFRPDNDSIIPMGSRITRPPNGVYFNVVENVQDQTYTVSLSQPPSDFAGINEELNSHAVLTEYHKYTRKNGYKYDPHCWPREQRKEMNKWRNPHIQPEDYLYHYAFVSPLHFWTMVQYLKVCQITYLSSYTYLTYSP